LFPDNAGGGSPPTIAKVRERGLLAAESFPFAFNAVKSERRLPDRQSSMHPSPLPPFFYRPSGIAQPLYFT